MGILDYDFNGNPLNGSPVSSGLLAFSKAISQPGANFSQALASGAEGAQSYTSGMFDRMAKQLEMQKTMQELQKSHMTNQLVQQLMGGDTAAPARKGLLDVYTQQPQASAPQRRGILSPPPERPRNPYSLIDSLRDYDPNKPQDQQQAAQTTPQPVAQPPARAGMNLNMLQALTLMNPQVGSALFNIQKYQNDGIEQKAGSFYKDPASGQMTYIPDPTKGINYDPSTNSVRVMNGFADANAQIKGHEAAAVKGAEYPYVIGAQNNQANNSMAIDNNKGMQVQNFEEFTMPDGTTRKVPVDHFGRIIPITNATAPNSTSQQPAPQIAGIGSAPSVAAAPPAANFAAGLPVAKQPTGEQARINAIRKNMQIAHEDLLKTQDRVIPWWAEMKPNFARGPNEQKFVLAKNNIGTNATYLISGAQAGEAEKAANTELYTPQSGDTLETLMTKNRSREQLLNATPAPQNLAIAPQNQAQSTLPPELEQKAQSLYAQAQARGKPLPIEYIRARLQQVPR